MAGKATPSTPAKPTGWGDEKPPAASSLEDRMTKLEQAQADPTSEFTGAEIVALRKLLERAGWDSDKESF